MYKRVQLRNTITWNLSLVLQFVFEGIYSNRVPVKEIDVKLTDNTQPLF